MTSMKSTTATERLWFCANVRRKVKKRYSRFQSIKHSFCSKRPNREFAQRVHERWPLRGLDSHVHEGKGVGHLGRLEVGEHQDELIEESGDD
jgi:hypothetical protein